MLTREAKVYSRTVACLACIAMCSNVSPANSEALASSLIILCRASGTYSRHRHFLPSSLGNAGHGHAFPSPPPPGFPFLRLLVSAPRSRRSHISNHQVRSLWYGMLMMKEWSSLQLLHNPSLSRLWPTGVRLSQLQVRERTSGPSLPSEKTGSWGNLLVNFVWAPRTPPCSRTSSSQRDQ